MLIIIRDIGLVFTLTLIAILLFGALLYVAKIRKKEVENQKVKKKRKHK